MAMLPLVLSSDSHVFEPPDLRQTRIDRRSEIVRRGSSGSAVPTNRGRKGPDPRRDRPDLARRRAVRGPETISADGRFEDVRRGARHAAEPAHGDATAGRDSRVRRQDLARRQ